MVRFQVKRPVNVDEARGAKLMEALGILERVVNSEAFRNRVIAHPAYTWDEGLSSEQIYNRLIWGTPSPTPGGLGVPRIVFFDYELVPRPWYKSERVIGWRIANTNDIFTYLDSFDDMTPAELASHLGHEIVGHLAGEFGHPEKAGDVRDRSVPYVIDGFIEELAPQFVKPGRSEAA
ncbi:hypothetical protein ACQKGO_25410 [Corallococcus interemptor]|uniref:hypothetical protein n=1 Tax=Corallococcus interemptor TaxID=2316720 RepID=UPI003D038BAB